MDFLGFSSCSYGFPGLFLSSPHGGPTPSLKAPRDQAHEAEDDGNDQGPHHEVRILGTGEAPQL